LPLGAAPPTFLYYAQIDNATQTLTQQVFDSLVEFNLQTYALEPALAESWEVSEDGTVYTFHLREGVTWHDGEPFTADDVKFTWELIAHPENLSAAQLYSFFSTITGAEAFHNGEADEITGITVVDDLTVDVALDSPWAPFFTIGSNQYIVPQHILGEVPVGEILEHEYARAPVG